MGGQGEAAGSPEDLIARKALVRVEKARGKADPQEVQESILIMPELLFPGTSSL